MKPYVYTLKKKIYDQTAGVKIGLVQKTKANRRKQKKKKTTMEVMCNTAM